MVIVVIEVVQLHHIVEILSCHFIDCVMQFVTMVRSDFKEVPMQQKDVWNFAITTSGARCVMTCGILMMPWLYADN